MWHHFLDQHTVGIHITEEEKKKDDDDDDDDDDFVDEMVNINI